MAPLLLSTWNFSLPIVEAHYPRLVTAGSAMDVVEACAQVAELDAELGSVGFGGTPDRDGHVTLDAAVMLSPARSGSVGGLERHIHAVSVARMVMERTRHKMLVGSAADDFADAQGMESENLLSKKARQRWERWRKSNAPPVSPLPTGAPDSSHDTIGTLALDAGGTIAGSCSTSGSAWKVPGRVGDSPIIGHGLYVDPARGAATATGLGELISGVCGSFLVVELMGRGASPAEAVHDTLARLAEAWDLEQNHQAAFIAMSPHGDWAGGALRNGFKIAAATEAGCLLHDPQVVLHPQDG